MIRFTAQLWRAGDEQLVLASAAAKPLTQRGGLRFRDPDYTRAKLLLTKVVVPPAARDQHPAAAGWGQPAV